MADEKTKRDNINSLCQKYFTPELCKEKITESPRTLELNLFEQMKKYGCKIAEKYSALTFEDKEEIIDDAIFSCIKSWREECPRKGNFTGYYYTVLKRELVKNNIAQGKKNESEVSIYNENENGKSSAECLEDKTENQKYPELEAVVEQLDKLESFYQKWCVGEEKKRAHKKNKNTIDCLSALLTFEMREEFLKYGRILKIEYDRSYSFLNKQILNMSQNLSKEKIGSLYGLKRDRASHILADFKKEFTTQVL